MSYGSRGTVNDAQLRLQKRRKVVYSLLELSSMKVVRAMGLRYQTIERLIELLDHVRTESGNRGETQVDIAVVGEAAKQPSLRTRANGKWNNNQLAQDE
jgi:hypothetical protein